MQSRRSAVVRLGYRHDLYDFPFVALPAISLRVTDTNGTPYPSAAYAPDGTLWWRLTHRPGSKRKYGDELKTSAWLCYHVGQGGVFTMAMLRAALGENDRPNSNEHLNRRLRALRERDGWVIYSNKDDGTLAVNEYRVAAIGWHPGLETERSKSGAVSLATRRKLFDRDGNRCVVCGVGSGEAYPGEPDVLAVLTAGHIVPNDRGGSSSDLNNLRTECKRCNEPVRQEIRSPETISEIRPLVRKLQLDQKRRLLSWIDQGQRGRDVVDEIYDKIRVQPPEFRDEVAEILRRSLSQ